MPSEAQPVRRPRLVITLGDPCGIGPELLLTSLSDLHAWADVLVVGARAGVDLLDRPEGPEPPVTWQWCEPEGPLAPAAPALSAFRGLRARPRWGDPRAPGGQALWLDPTPEVEPGHLTLGQGSALSGRCAVEAVRAGARWVQAGLADALVTLPLAKSAAHQAGFNIPGHTEFLQALAGAPLTRMAFVSPTLSVVLHTVHQSLRSVVEELSAEAVAETLVFSARQFCRMTGKADLRVALCALNPHAGEGGAFGHEEALLERALVMAESAFPPAGQPGPRFEGPFPSDTLFLRAVRGEFDLVVALYHDQGLIPIKVLEPDRAVNLTLGLPFVRTSPDHGTAFDRAGHWTASAVNFQEAAALAARLSAGAPPQP